MFSKLSKEDQELVCDFSDTKVGLDGQDWIIEMVNNIIIEVLSSIAEQERTTIKKRQAEGIEAAKAQGKIFGRPKFVFPDNWTEVYDRWNKGQIKAKEAMSLLGVKRTTFYKYVRIYEQEQKDDMPKG